MIFRNFNLTSFAAGGEMTAEVDVFSWRTLWLNACRVRVYKPSRSEPWCFETGEPIPGHGCAVAFCDWWHREYDKLGCNPISICNTNVRATEGDLA